MKKIYNAPRALAAGIAMLSFQIFNGQVYTIATNDLFYPGGVSNNGVVSINAGANVFMWDKDNGLMQIGGITNGYNFGGSAIINADGTLISAGITNPDSAMNEISVFDISKESWTHLGGISEEGSDGALSSAWGMSSDGTTIVGLGWYNGGGAHAIKWDAVNGLVDMGSTIPESSSRANAISSDKNVIVGWQDQVDGFRTAVRWVNGVQEFIKDTDGNFVGEAAAVSANGKVIVGGNGLYPYVWNEESGYQEIAHPQSGAFFRGAAVAVTDDGKTVIGYYRPWPGGPMMGEGFIWTQENGRQNLNDYVSSLGLDTKGITFGLPLAMSKDGKKIAGIGMDANFVATTYLIDLTSALATNDVKVNKLTIYPNPVKDILYISTKDKIDGIEIYSIAGQLVKSITTKSNTINVSSLPKGNYIVRVTIKGQVQNLKMMKN